MSSPVITADINLSVGEAATLMHERGIRRLPLTDGGKLAGIITQTDIAKALRRLHQEVSVAVEEKIIKAPLKHNLQFGKTYIYQEQKPDEAVRAFVDLVKHGTPGLLLTRKKPTIIADEWGLDKTPIVWLTNAYPEGRFADPHDIQGISILVGNYFSQAVKSVMMIDGITYLITQNKFDTVLNLLQNVRDKAVKSESILIISLNPETLKKQELELIKQEADEIM